MMFAGLKPIKNLVIRYGFCNILLYFLKFHRLHDKKSDLICIY